MRAPVKRGDLFTHHRLLDLSWVPQPGQTWSEDAPNAVMVVTRVTSTTVFYRYADSPGPASHRMSVSEFIGLYGGREEGESGGA